MSEVQKVQFWTKVFGVMEEPRVMTFGLIPEGWEGELEDHPEDDQVFFWCDEEEFKSLGAGEIIGGDIELVACACDECESERHADDWVGVFK